MPGPGPGPAASSVSQACAACKHQRRRCVPECPLAPFFPPNSHKDFLNSHRFFGVRNIMNTIRRVESPNRENAVKSMILEANFRARDPVGGSCRIAKELELKLRQAMAELDFVIYQVSMFRAHDQIQNPTSYDDGMQNGFWGIQPPSYYIGESSSNIGESSAMKPSPPPSSIHMEALAKMKPPPPKMEALAAMKSSLNLEKPPKMEALAAMKSYLTLEKNTAMKSSLNLEKNKKGELEDT